MAKNAMIWGASGGIGRALVSALLADDWQVAALSRHGDGLDDATLYVEADPGDDFSVQQAVLQRRARAGRDQPVDLQRGRHQRRQGWRDGGGDVAAHSRRQPDGRLHRHPPQPAAAGGGCTLVLSGRVQRKIAAAGAGRLRRGQGRAGSLWRGPGQGRAQAHQVTIVRPPAVDTPLWEKMPLRLPKEALSPQSVAEQILAAYADGTKGQLDL